MEIVFSPPSRSDPGFLRRSKIILEFRQMQTVKPSPEMVDKMVEFLLQYVKEPKDRNEAREALYDASEERIYELISLVSGKPEEENPTTAQTMNEPSNTAPEE